LENLQDGEPCPKIEFRNRPDQPPCPPSLLCNGLFPGV